jgi:DNA repair protein RecO (recombination protein O)
MEWRDEGIVLAVRKHSESSVIVSVLTAHHGRHAGLVRGGSGRRQRGVLQSGNQVAVVWRARLADHLGRYHVELARARAAAVLDDAARLAAVTAACALIERAFPEREPVASAYAALVAMLDAVEASPAWPRRYVRWEMALLAELGYALDVERCAVTGATDGLAFVSPASGRAVTAAAAGPYRGRLLPLPAFLARAEDTATVPAAEIAAGLALTGHFLAANVFNQRTKPLPAARLRLLDYFHAQATKYGA